jgi:hypothetical protein
VPHNPSGIHQVGRGTILLHHQVCVVLILKFDPHHVEKEEDCILTQGLISKFNNVCLKLAKLHA